MWLMAFAAERTNCGQFTSCFISLTSWLAFSWLKSAPANLADCPVAAPNTLWHGHIEHKRPGFPAFFGNFGIIKFQRLIIPAC